MRKNKLKWKKWYFPISLNYILLFLWLYVGTYIYIKLFTRAHYRHKWNDVVHMCDDVVPILQTEHHDTYVTYNIHFLQCVCLCLIFLSPTEHTHVLSWLNVSRRCDKSLIINDQASVVYNKMNYMYMFLLHNYLYSSWYI